MAGAATLLGRSLAAPFLQFGGLLKAALLPFLLLALFRYYGRDFIPAQWDPDIHAFADHFMTWSCQGAFLLIWLRHLIREKSGDLPLVPFMAAYAILFILQEIFKWLISHGLAYIATEVFAGHGTDPSDSSIWAVYFLIAALTSFAAYAVIFRLALGLPDQAAGENAGMDQAWQAGGAAPVRLTLLTLGLFLVEFILTQLFQILPALFPGLQNFFFSGMYLAIDLYLFLIQIYLLGTFAAALAHFRGRA